MGEIDNAVVAHLLDLEPARPTNTTRVTIWVERASGYVAGHCKTFADADDLVARCNAHVPSDPARVRWADNLAEWAKLLGDAAI